MTNQDDEIPKIEWDGSDGSPINSFSDEDMCKASLAFDQWFSCLTVGKQLNNFYRYGEKQGCGKHWRKLRLCMGVKLRSQEGRRKMIREFNEKEEQERNNKPNLLDVWTYRTERLKDFPAIHSENNDENPQSPV